jgi:hypothetical protein
MTAFDDRERAFEAKFAHDEEILFRTRARAMRQTAAWAAALTGRSGAAAEAYVGEVMHSDVQHAGHADALARLEADLAGLATPAELRARLAEALRAAKAEALDAA